MHKRNRWMLLTLCGAFLFSTAAAAAETAEAAAGEEIKLQRIEAKDALTMVRTLAGTGRVQIADAYALRIQDTPEKVLLARKIVALVEGTECATDAGARYEVGDGTTVACRALRHTSGNEVMAALRTLAIRRIGLVRAPPLVLVRDRAEKLDAALAKIRELDRAAPKTP